MTTIEKLSFAQNIARAFSSSSGTGNASSSSSTTYSDNITTDVIQRHLAFPDELMVMRDNKELIFIESFNPIAAKKLAWFDDDRLKNLGINLHKKTETISTNGESTAQLYQENPETQEAEKIQMGIIETAIEGLSEAWDKLTTKYSGKK